MFQKQEQARPLQGWSKCVEDHTSTLEGRGLALQCIQFGAGGGGVPQRAKMLLG